MGLHNGKLVGESATDKEPNLGLQVSGLYFSFGLLSEAPLTPWDESRRGLMPWRVEKGYL